MDPLLASVKNASKHVTLATIHRNEMIRRALEQHTVRVVAAAADLSPTRVHQIGKQ